MYINRALLAAFGILLIFLPTVENWLFHEQAAWYRPFALWGVVVVAAYWNQRSRIPDEL
jgi:uncharacterized membrane protein